MQPINEVLCECFSDVGLNQSSANSVEVLKNIRYSSWNPSRIFANLYPAKVYFSLKL